MAASMTVWIESPQGKCEMPVSQCHCATLSVCPQCVTVPRCPFVHSVSLCHAVRLSTVPVWNSRGGGKLLNVYDHSSHLVLHSTTLPPAVKSLQLYVKCNIEGGT